jgi:transcriptional regulator GlxA family with amidase domain
VAYALTVKLKTEIQVRIGIMLFEGVEELDFAGPWEVLAVWARLHPEDGVAVVTVADHVEPVRCANGLRVIAHGTWSDAGKLDVLVLPGGWGSDRQLGEPHLLERLRDLSAGGTLMTSVCSGALVFAQAGLLANRPATTHWSDLDRLRQISPSTDVQPTARFLDSGEVITASGVSAGIDMALHLVARLQSTDRAREIRRYIQYDPAPPV